MLRRNNPLTYEILLLFIYCKAYNLDKSVSNSAYSNDLTDGLETLSTQADP